MRSIYTHSLTREAPSSLHGVALRCPGSSFLWQESSIVESEAFPSDRLVAHRKKVPRNPPPTFRFVQDNGTLRSNPGRQQGIRCKAPRSDD